MKTFHAFGELLSAFSNQVNFTTGSTSRPLTLTLYPLNGNKAYVMDSTPVATSAQVLGGVITGHHGNLCLAKGLNASFDNTALGTAGSGAVFGVHGNQLAVATGTVGSLTNLTPNGGGGCAANQGSASLPPISIKAGLRTPSMPYRYRRTDDSGGEGSARAPLGFVDPARSGEGG